MSFYNEYRPTRFDEVVGQPENITILWNQSRNKAWAHSYLFYGASGTGKTSTARILAMTLNCSHLDKETGEPCGKCVSCKAIKAGAYWDLIEVDGARFNGKDDVKDLCYKAVFAPLGKYKVYIIDECHALSEQAWNSLLKLIEEPPPHLVIILCTTEFEKIPETVKSRCQLYHFHSLRDTDMVVKLKRICEAEGVTPDQRHLQFIVESSAGNMRRAENTLEQVCQMSGPRRSASKVKGKQKVMPVNDTPLLRG